MPAPAARAATHKQKAGATPTSTPTKGAAAQLAQQDGNSSVRLHITPFNPALLKVYLAPSVLPQAQNTSYHTVETFPEKGYGYIELPAMEATKLKKKLNGSTLKGSKVRIEDAKPEKRKVREEADAAKENEEAERPVKRAKKDKKKKKEQGVLDGVELSGERKVKRGWTEPPAKSKKEKKEKKDKDKTLKQKDSKYTKEPELLFKAKLTPVAATEVARKEKSKDKDKKKDKKKSKSKREIIVHEFEKNSKTPSFLKATKVSTETKPALEYINGKGWVDEDGNVVESERAKVKNRRVLELVEPVQPTIEKKSSATPSPKSSPAPKTAKKDKKGKKAVKVTPPPSSSSESEDDDEESSVVSSSSEDTSSESEANEDDEEPTKTSSARASNTPEVTLTPSSPSNKGVHPLEALFKRPKPSLSTPTLTSTQAKSLAPINTSFSFFDNNDDAMDVDVDNAENPPVTPFTQRDLEWRGLRSAAPTPDTAAIGRRFSFPWRNSSQEADDDDDEDIEAGIQLNSNTIANSSTKHLPDLAEEDEEEEEEEAEAEAEAEDEETQEKPESEFRKWFWENQGNLNRAWKKRRRDALKAKRLSDNRKATGGRRVA